LLGFFILVLFSQLLVGSLFYGFSLLADSVVGAPIAAFLRDTSLIALVSITAAVYFARRWYDRRSFTSLGLERNRAVGLDLLVGFLIPGLMMGLIFLVEWNLGWLQVQGKTWQTDSEIWLAAGYFFAVFVMVGWYEELLTRGYLLQNLADGLSMPLAVLISSAFFGIAHLANPNATWASVLGILAAGYFLAYAYLWTRHLWLPIGLHIGWNFFEGPVFGFPVSGLETARLLDTAVSGPDLVTGGAFGPEAGLILLPALAIGGFLTYGYARKSAPLRTETNSSG
jgi:hypothetical protein